MTGNCETRELGANIPITRIVFYSFTKRFYLHMINKVLLYTN